MKYILPIIFLLSLVTFSSCDSENHKRVKYQVNSPSKVAIFYTMNNRSFDITEEAGSWSVSYRAKVGSTFYLSAIKSGLFGNVRLTVSIDGEVYDQIESSDLDPQVLEGVVP